MKPKIVHHDGYVKVEYQHLGGRTRKSTGVAIPDKTSLKSNGSLKSSVKEHQQNQKTIDAYLMRANEIVADHVHKYKASPTGAQFKKAWDEHDRKAKDSKKLLDYYERFYKSKELEFSRVGFNPDSIKDYRNLRYYLEDFELDNQCSISLEDISRDWMNTFVIFLETKRKDFDKPRTKGGKYHSRGGLAGKTVKKRIGLFIGFFNWLDAENLLELPKSLNNYYRTLEGSEAVKAIITKEEVNRLYKYDFEDSRFNFVKDVFVFTCFTGLRWNDLQTLNKKDVVTHTKAGRMIEKQAGKTKEWYRVPLNSITEKILGKYNFNFTRLSNVEFNQALKKLLMLTEWFNDETKFKDDDGNFLPRWACISIHRGRDSFCTMLVNDRVPLNEIMKYTGHRSVTSLNMYMDKKADIANFTNELVIQ